MPLAATGFLGVAGETAQGPAPALKAPSFPAPKGYVCYRATAPIQIDGRLDEEDWKAAPWTDAFVDIRGRCPTSAPVSDPGQDALGQHLFLRRRPSWKNRTSGARSPSTTRSSSTITTSRSSSILTATTKNITRSRSMHSIPNGTCSSRRRTATAGRRSTSGRSLA